MLFMTCQYLFLAKVGFTGSKPTFLARDITETVPVGAWNMPPDSFQAVRLADAEGGEDILHNAAGSFAVTVADGPDRAKRKV